MSDPISFDGYQDPRTKAGYAVLDTQRLALNSGPAPTAEDRLVDDVLRHARHEAVVREMASRGHVMIGTSVLENVARINAAKAGTPLPAPRRYNVLDRMGHLFEWLLTGKKPARPAAVPAADATQYSKITGPITA